MAGSIPSRTKHSVWSLSFTCGIEKEQWFMIASWSGTRRKSFVFTSWKIALSRMVMHSEWDRVELSGSVDGQSAA